MRRSLLMIFFMTAIISGIPWGIYTFYHLYLRMKKTDPHFYVRALMVSSKSHLSLKPSLWSEILGLSLDHPVNLYEIDLKQLKEKALNISAIKEVEFKKISPSTLYISYLLREPVFLLGNRSNTYLDKEGIFFPSHPFYTSKNICRLYLPDEDIQEWGKKLSEEDLLIANEVISVFPQSMRLESIDLRKRQALSLGEREIVLQSGASFIRIDSELWKKNIAHLIKISHLKPQVIDLRITGLAIIK